MIEKEMSNKGYNLVTCENSNQCYQMLKNNEGDAFIHTNTMVLAYEVIDPSLEVSVQNMGETEFIDIGVQKGNSTLQEFLNKTPVELSKENFFLESFNKTLNPFYKGKADKNTSCWMISI